ncbi:MAG: hypothetical protein U0795_15290 [Pirellulales bacterium]
MGIFTTQWEDEENNRILELHVQYRLDGSSLEIDAVTPASVTFVDQHSREPIRKIGVHTRAGKGMLLQRFHHSNGLDEVRETMLSALSVKA